MEGRIFKIHSFISNDTNPKFTYDYFNTETKKFTIPNKGYENFAKDVSTLKTNYYQIKCPDKSIIYDSNNKIIEYKDIDNITYKIGDCIQSNTRNSNNIYKIVSFDYDNTKNIITFDAKNKMNYSQSINVIGCLGHVYKKQTDCIQLNIEYNNYDIISYKDASGNVYKIGDCIININNKRIFTITKFIDDNGVSFNATPKILNVTNISAEGVINLGKIFKLFSCDKDANADPNADPNADSYEEMTAEEERARDGGEVLP